MILGSLAGQQAARGPLGNRADRSGACREAVVLFFAGDCIQYGCLSSTFLEIPVLCLTFIHFSNTF